MLMVQRSLTMELTNQGQGHPRTPLTFTKMSDPIYQVWNKTVRSIKVLIFI